MFEHRKRGSNGGMMVVKTNSSGEIISPLSPMQPESPNTKEDCGLGISSPTWMEDQGLNKFDRASPPFHRAAGFTRRLQRATGIMADSRHELWSPNRLKENMIIESLRSPTGQKQRLLVREKERLGTADEPHLRSLETRQQKRTAGVAIAMAANNHQKRGDVRMRSRIAANSGEVLQVPALEPTMAQVALRTSKRALARAEKVRTLVGHPQPQSEVLDLTRTEPIAPEMNKHPTSDEEDTSSFQPARRRSCENEKSGARHRYQSQTKFHSPSSRGRHSDTRPIVSPHLLATFSPQEGEVLPKLPSSPQQERTKKGPGGYRHWLKSSDGAKVDNHVYYNIPHALRNVSPMQYMTAVKMMLTDSPSKVHAGQKSTAEGKRPATMYSSHSVYSQASDDAASAGISHAPCSASAPAGAPGIRLWDHTFASRKKKHGTGPILKDARERQVLLERGISEHTLNLQEEPITWMQIRQNRALRRKVEEWQRILTYKEPKMHGGKRVFFQAALRNAIGPRLELRQLTYDAIQTKNLMEASQLFVPPSAKESAMTMLNHTQAHNLELSEPKNKMAWPMKRFHQRVLPPHTRDGVFSVALESTEADYELEKLPEETAEENTKYAFRLLDLDNDGELTKEEFGRFIGLLDEEAFASMDKDHDGMVDMDELLKYEVGRQKAMLKAAEDAAAASASAAARAMNIKKPKRDLEERDALLQELLLDD